MVAANIKTQSLNLGETGKSVKTSRTNNKNSKTSFDDFMNLSSNENNVKPNEITSKAKENMQDSGKKIISGDKEAEISDSVKDYVKSMFEDQKGNVSNVDVQDEDQLALLVNMSNLMNTLQITITQVLGISDETLAQAMEELGFDSADLLNTDNLKQLVLFLNNSQDVADLLTNESLGDSLHELLETVSQFKVDNNISEEKIANLEQLNNQPAFSANELNRAENMSNVETEPEIIVMKDDVKPQSEDNRGEFSKENTSDHSGEDTKSLTPADVFIQNLAARPLQEAGFTEQIANIRHLQEITDQIVEQIKITINPGQTAMELQLNPENLGKVNLSVVYKDGVMTAHFTAQNEAVKEAIESQIQFLKDNLSNQGLKVESVEVTVSNFAFDDQTSADTGKESKQPGQRNRNFRTIDDLGLGEEQGAVTPDRLDDSISTVDFIA